VASSSLVRGVFVVVRDGVDPSTSGFSDQHPQMIDTSLTWDDAGETTPDRGSVGRTLVTRSQTRRYQRCAQKRRDQGLFDWAVQFDTVLTHSL
jgi:hypothetical protein